MTDKLRSYSAAHREVMPSVAQDTQRYANNRSEVSHQPTRHRERQRDFGGVRCEEDFLITADGGRRLGPPKPKTIEEIEALRGS